MNPWSRTFLYPTCLSRVHYCSEGISINVEPPRPVSPPQESKFFLVLDALEAEALSHSPNTSKREKGHLSPKESPHEKEHKEKEHKERGREKDKKLSMSNEFPIRGRERESLTPRERSSDDDSWNLDVPSRNEKRATQFLYDLDFSTLEAKFGSKQTQEGRLSLWGNGDLPTAALKLLGPTAPKAQVTEGKMTILEQPSDRELEILFRMDAAVVEAQRATPKVGKLDLKNLDGGDTPASSNYHKLIDLSAKTLSPVNSPGSQSSQSSQSSAYGLESDRPDPPNSNRKRGDTVGASSPKRKRKDEKS